MTGDVASGPPQAVHHLHRTSIFFGAISTLPSMFGAIVGLWMWHYFRGEGVVPTIMTSLAGSALIVGVLGVIAYHTVRYYVLTIRYEGDELVINSGLLFRTQRHIPYRKIQNIDVIQNVLHRLFKVAVVKIETSSGSEADAELRVLSLDTIEQMRRYVFKDHEKVDQPDGVSDDDVQTQAHAHAVHADEREILSLNRRDLVVLGLIVNRGLVLVTAVAGLAWQANWQFDLWERPEAAATIFGWTVEMPANAFVWILIALGAVALIMLLSVGWSILRFDQFRMNLRDEDIRISCGLLTRVHGTIPKKRIQFITIHQSPLHRLFGKATVRIETAGGNVEDDETALLSRRWFVPIVDQTAVDALISQVAPEFAMDEVNWQPLAPKARRRMIRRSVIFSSALGIAATIVFWPWGIALWLAMSLAAAAHAWRAAAITRWAVTDKGVLFRNGVLKRKTSITLFNRIQTPKVIETPFDRRWSMASVSVDTAGAGTAGHRIAIRFLPRQLADDLRMRIAKRAEAAGFHWA